MDPTPSLSQVPKRRTSRKGFRRVASVSCRAFASRRHVVDRGKAMLFLRNVVRGDHVKDGLGRGIHPRRLPLEAALLDDLARRFQDWQALASPPLDGQPGQGSLGPSIVAFLSEEVRRELDQIAGLRGHFDAYSARFAAAPTEAERTEQVLEFARILGARESELKGDRRALKRWFGHDAIVDRFRYRISTAERRLALILDRCGAMAAHSIEQQGGSVGYLRLWQRLDLEKTFHLAGVYEGDSRVRAAAFRCLIEGLKALPPEIQERSVGEATLRFIYRATLDPALDVWVQREALSALQTISASAFVEVLRRRLVDPAGGDDFFVRRHAVLLLGANLSGLPALVELIPVACADPSPFARQAVARLLPVAPPQVALESYRRLVRDDAEPSVRAATLLETGELFGRPDLGGAVLDEFVHVLRAEGDPFVLRTALKVAADGLGLLVQQADPEGAARWHASLWPEVERLHTSAEALTVRRWAAQARERMWCTGDPAARDLLKQLRRQVEGLRPGRSRRLPRNLVAGADVPILGRVLALLALEDHGYEIRHGLLGPRIARGDRFRFRLWRLLHEVRHPSPDKRQAFRHTIGRVFLGRTQAPSAILAELAQTKVPGEPLMNSEEGGWRPYLPLVDQAISAIDTGRTVSLFTSEGVTDLEPPRGLWRRLRARWSLSRRFEQVASLRNWTRQSSLPPSTYLRALEEVGLKSRIRPYPAGAAGVDGSTSLDPAVQRFFPAVLPLPALNLWERLQGYFFSVYQNTLFHLALFVGAAALYFLGRHLYLNRKLREARGSIPLVVGGWGTRGKSGTERLKAALINGLGYGLVSKTTGCEAMFLHAYPFGSTREMFLFRPYDKATIWEQLNVVRLAPKLRGEVFLWECMGLSPSYVRVLQRHWMTDDIATVTNTYPDHEDLQGPAGRDIPEVMVNFVPQRSRLLTSEEQMLPILLDGARSLRTSVRSVGWLEAGLIPPDVLRRFPYEEHPYNIALVVAVADELGVGRDFALKEMADRVVPDLGVLKTYPLAPVRTRRLEFVNGMSANERFGALGNWSRMGFDRQDPEREPGVWITTVVNNRADRVPRSRVFANILVADIWADRHVLIGGNLEGLFGYIDEAWNDHAQGLSLWPDDGAADEPAAAARRTLAEMARWLRVPRSDGQVSNILRAMLEGQPEPLDVEALVGLRDAPEQLRERLAAAGMDEAEGILVHLGAAAEALHEYRQFDERIAAEAAEARRDGLNTDFRNLARRWFQRKIVVVEDYYATGDQIVERVARETPPGFHNRIMGIQNIKGTGLDFVYRFQTWETCYRACELARSDDPLVADEGRRALASFHENGVLTEEYVRATVEQARREPSAQSDAVRAELALILDHLDRDMASVREKMALTGGTGFFARLVSGIEAVLDAGDAVRRRRMADQIYRDLTTRRISHDRAALELQTLTKRQKGGWLLKTMQEFVRRPFPLFCSTRAHRRHGRHDGAVPRDDAGHGRP
jgi:gamma-polyglutamate synthase